MSDYITYIKLNAEIFPLQSTLQNDKSLLDILTAVFDKWEGYFEILKLYL